MFGNTITMADAGIITLFSMGIVFSALLVISYTIDVMRAALSKPKKENKVETVQQPQQQIVETPEEDDTELVAILTAAIASSLGKSANSLIVRNIKRLPDMDPVWSRSGRLEIMR